MIGKFVLGLKLLSTSCAYKLWLLLISVDNEMFLKFSWLPEAFATFRTRVEILLLSVFSISFAVFLLRFTRFIDVSLFRIVSLPRDNSLMFEQHMIPVGEMVVEGSQTALLAALNVISVLCSVLQKRRFLNIKYIKMD